MIEINIAQGRKGWAAVVKQWADDNHIARILYRIFPTDIEAWEWARKTANRWKESSA